MIKCNCCGRENSNYAIYCEGCGSLLTTVTDSTDVNTNASDVYSSEPAPENSPEPETSSSYSSDYTSTESTYQPETVQSGEYIPPEYTYDPNPQVTTGMEIDGVCIAGLICSVSGLFCCGLPAIAGLVLSIIGLVRAKNSGKKGAGLAIAGIVIAILSIIIGIIILLAGNGNSYSYYSSGRHH